MDHADQVELKAKAQMLAELHLIKPLRHEGRPVQASLNEKAASRSGGFFVANSTLTCPEGKLLVLGYPDYSGMQHLLSNQRGTALGVM